MKRTLSLCTALVLGCSFGAFAQSDLSPMDKKFVTDAASGGMLEVQLGQLAQSKGSSDFVKQFGQKMVDDHTKANDKLKDIAQKDNITLPTSLLPKDQATYDKMSKLSGASFDSAYVSDMRMDHKKDVADFKKEAATGSNPDIKGFASETLPTLEQHLHIIMTKKMM